MLEPHQIEELICLVALMDRETLTDKFLNFHGQFPVDFTPDFLESISIDRMRHIFVALCMQSRQLPELAMTTAA